MKILKLLVFLCLTISNANGKCDSFTESEDAVILSCLTGLYSLNITGVLSIDQGCRYYNHVLMCISNKLNGTCEVTDLHNHVPDYLKTKPRIRHFFQECTVSEVITSHGFCKDSAAVLISGISVCVPKEIPSSCDYIGSVFLKCYHTYELDDYFQCSKRQMREAFENKSEWFLDKWSLNMSSCWNGNNIITDICSSPMLQYNISMQYCEFLVDDFDKAGIMTQEDMCRQYIHYLKCVEELFDIFNVDGNYKCSLTSLHNWIPNYFKANMYVYSGIERFNASVCKVSESMMIDYCADKRAVFLTNINHCTISSDEIFECRYIRTLVESCEASLRFYNNTPTNMKCTNRQKELALESEAQYFQTKFSINVTKCIHGRQRICNRNVTDRNIVYSHFYKCFGKMGDYSGYNRSGLLSLSEGCRINNYAMHCVKERLEKFTSYRGCDIHDITKWFKGEFYIKSAVAKLVPNCNVTTNLNASFCEDSRAVFFGMLGFCSQSYYLKFSGTEKKDVCSNVNFVLQLCYNSDILSRFGCSFAESESSIINNALAIIDTYGSNIDIASCFKGCLSSSSCSPGKLTGVAPYASFNSTRCACHQYCISGYETCCPDFYDECVCTSAFWGYLDSRKCEYLLSNFNQTGTMNEDDVCRLYSYYLNCLQTQTMCPLQLIKKLVSDNIRDIYYDIYRIVTSGCNVSMVTSLSEFCSDERILFEVGVNSECTASIYLYVSTCRYLDIIANACYGWHFASRNISCSHRQRRNALLGNSDWFYKTWNINISVCKEVLETTEVVNWQTTTETSSTQTEHSTISTTPIPVHEAIHIEMSLKIDIQVKSQNELDQNKTYYEENAKAMLEKIYSDVLTQFEIRIRRLRVGILIIEYDIKAKKSEAPQVSKATFEAVNGNVILAFDNLTPKVLNAIIGSNDEKVEITPNQDKRESLCKIFSSVSECPYDYCELDGDIPKCRIKPTNASYTSGLVIGLISGTCLIIIIIIFVSVIKIVNHRKNITEKSGSLQDVGMEKDDKHTYESFPHTTDHFKGLSDDGSNHYYSISSGSSWRETVTDDYQTLSKFKIQRPTMLFQDTSKKDTVLKPGPTNVEDDCDVEYIHVY